MRDRVVVLARATFVEAMRDRMLLVVALFALGMVLFSRVLGWLSIEDELKMVQDFSLSGISCLALFLAMLVGAFSVAKEVERRTLYPLLSRDLTRGEFVVGKYLGLVFATWSCLAGAGIALLLWVAVWGGHPGEALLAALLGLLCESLLLVAVALFLGMLTAPAIAALGTCGFALAARSTEALRELASSGRADNAGFWSFAYQLLPNTEDVNFINATTTGLPIHWEQLLMGAAAMALWSTVFVGGAVVLFKRREF
ncbi:MAG: ABC transporter permease [Planctomycetes bacterium]|nr:ABC transporter permease [Planctomycetota bacterium]